MHNTFQEHLFRVLSGQDTLDSLAENFNGTPKQFKRYMYTHGYTKILSMPIILFDLNGTLCNRTDRNRVINLRPHIQELKKLKKYYRVGVFTSCTRYNALMICDQIEDKCGKIFDRHLIFTSEHTIPFNEKERMAFNLPEYKRKKSLATIFHPSVLPNVTIVDDELIRIVEQKNAIQIKGWYGDLPDESLNNLIEDLINKQSPIAKPQVPRTPPIQVQFKVQVYSQELVTCSSP
jgi:hypothetical protein